MVLREMSKIARKVMSMIMIGCFMFTGTALPTYAANSGNILTTVSSTSEYDQLEKAYRQLSLYANLCNAQMTMPLEDFVAGYDRDVHKDANAYLKTYTDVLQPNIITKNKMMSKSMDSAIVRGSSSSSGGGAVDWQYNTGTSLPRRANYSRYTLIDTATKGDIIFDSAGGFGITAHVGIVEGKFYSSRFNQYYIRIIEAIGVGVARSVVDDGRYDARGSSLHRVRRAPSYKTSGAVSFAIGQLGKKYSLDFGHDTSPNEKDWYCSELVWAAYKSQGYDLEATGITEPGITPRDLIGASHVTRLRIYAK